MLTDNQIKLIVGSLLHDIGKVVYRSGDGRNHSQSGYEYLKNEADIHDVKILNCVRYHHGVYLKNARIPEDDVAYITYFSDNVAAFSDRRAAENPEDGFDKTMPLDSVFNILNDNKGNGHYAMQVLDVKKGINYPTETPVKTDDYFYKTVIHNITENLKGITFDEEYLNSLLLVLEANLSYIPSSTSRRELADVSLYDHMKMTAAVASCVEQYLEERSENNYRKYLLENAKQAYDEKMFLLYSMDISGIQKFIYTIADKGALKGLRARSFYLEIMMEHLVDELLMQLSLSRANLIYTGGGHSYILLPNTKHVRESLERYEQEINHWFTEKFDIALYMASSYAMASANDLRNVPEGSYSELYLKMSKRISEKKGHRYNGDMIRFMNHRNKDGERECKVCRRTGQLIDDKCPICRALENVSGSIMKKEKKYFTVVCEALENSLPLPQNKYLIVDTKESLLKNMEKDTYVRCYTKNDIYTGKHMMTKIWVGDYTTGDTFEQFAEQADGIKRIGVLRADVDNLGTTFVYGFQRKNGDGKYATLSRAATLSRQLSLFFKCYINELLEKEERKVTIVYSGGDDVFLVGAWNDVIAACVDLKNALERFTEGTLTISGGIGIYPSKYPVNIMAKEVERLEDNSKNMDGKNAITIFDENHGYPWDEFENKVLNEKLSAIKEYFAEEDERGMAFLYHLVDLLRNTEEKINTARYVYLLSRMEPEKDENGKRENYRKFSKKMYEWSKDECDRKQLITAIYLYVYLNRERGEQTDETDRR